MRKLRYVLPMFMLMSFAVAMNAQVDEVMFRLRAGHNASFGGFAAYSFETAQNFGDNWQLSGGIQYNTIGKTTFEARPSFYLYYDWGRLSAEALFAYKYLSSVNSYAAGAGAEFSCGWLAVKLGYYHHLYGLSGAYVREPFNIYYELRVNLPVMPKSWELQLIITNNERFELERHYQPTFIAQSDYDMNDFLGLTMGVGCKPAGMFNLTADYYQCFLNLGVSYKW